MKHSAPIDEALFQRLFAVYNVLSTPVALFLQEEGTTPLPAYYDSLESLAQALWDFLRSEVSRADQTWGYLPISRADQITTTG